MTSPAARQEAARISKIFQDAGATPVETELLLPADILLDLYGEDIRARAYVTQDPVRGELMMRPDFTVPVVQMHMNSGAEPARYTYQGRVFRMQDAGTGRASEYLQVGLELFDENTPSIADAEIFSIIFQSLEPYELRAATGDIGILRAAVSGLSTSEPRRKALQRHIWRPRRFRALLDRFAGQAAAPSGREDILAALNNTHPSTLVATHREQPGLRSIEDVCDRLEILQKDALTDDIPASEYAAIGALLNMSASLPDALVALREIAHDLPSIGPAVDGFEARLIALKDRNIAIDNLFFEGSYGRTSLEYYDGFVFGFYPMDGGAPVATGGRYDALTRVLGQGRAIPAVGGVIRPEATAELRK
ncbi:MAG: ATP phosphoribosyltransferase regulatory subunit [Pseudomonadota bacterium]